MIDNEYVLHDVNQYPIYQLFRATKQIVPVVGCYDGTIPVKVIVDGIFLSKNFGPLYTKPAFEATIRNTEGRMFFTFDEEDTDTPGFLNVQIFSRVSFLQFWFSVSAKTAKEVIDALPANG